MKKEVKKTVLNYMEGERTELTVRQYQRETRRPNFYGKYRPQ